MSGRSQYGRFSFQLQIKNASSFKRFILFLINCQIISDQLNHARFTLFQLYHAGLVYLALIGYYRKLISRSLD